MNTEESAGESGSSPLHVHVTLTPMVSTILWGQVMMSTG
jgi:hypothetical protein